MGSRRAATKGTIRGRIMVAMVALAGFALITSGMIVAVVQHRKLEASVNERLYLVQSELRLLAEKGRDPRTGTVYRGPSQLLHAYITRTVPGPQEGQLAFVGSKQRWRPDAQDVLLLEKDEELMNFVARHVTGDVIVVETVHTKQRSYRVLVAPVVFPDKRGALVHAVDLSAAERELRRTMTLYAAVALLSVIVVVCLAWLSIGRLLRPIEELRATADSIHDHDLTSRVPVQGHDELSALSVTINHMLDRVQDSVEGQQRLLDDVGHELRTPITVVRGHMELVDVQDPEDVRQTRELVIDELDRMGAMVNDLLLLAKATQSDFVKPCWYDLATLTDQVLEKARGLGPHAWRLESVAAAKAHLDPARMTQAWLQLAANAVKYSEPGSPITLGSRLNGGEAELWVRDVGIGISPADLETVRHRFVRTQRATTHAAGSGLGLSIVESIVTAHHGRLKIDSVEGEGSTFTIVIPLAGRGDSP